MSEFDKSISNIAAEEVGKLISRVIIVGLVFLAAYYEHLCFTIVFCILWLKQKPMRSELIK